MVTGYWSSVVLSSDVVTDVAKAPATVSDVAKAAAAVTDVAKAPASITDVAQGVAAIKMRAASPSMQPASGAPERLAALMDSLVVATDAASLEAIAAELRALHQGCNPVADAYRTMAVKAEAALDIASRRAAGLSAIGRNPERR
jgi:hypothetical protein